MNDTLDPKNLNIICRFIRSGDVVFEIGADVSQWTDAVLKQCWSDRLQIHHFEPHPQRYQQFVGHFARVIHLGQIVPHNFVPFDLDAYCQQWQIKRINFLKIDVAGNELEILQGATRLLQAGKIDYLQFNCSRKSQDAGKFLTPVFEHLKRDRYSIFEVSTNDLDNKLQVLPERGNSRESNFLAVNERFVSGILGEFPQMLNLAKLCRQHGIQPRGVVHIGAYEGEEAYAYREMGIAKVLFVEANPQVFARLQKKMAALPEVKVANYALCDRAGWVELHVAVNEQSSSILSPKQESDQNVYTREISRVMVEAKTLDGLLADLELAPEEFNLLNIDIQGAELLALRGATRALRFVDGINIEVNYEEIYQGCALIDEIDEFLENVGFHRVATTTPYHPAWGDAFYVRKPTITMSTLGKNGGFANQLFQYGFLKTYAKKHQLRVETPAWIGREIFGLDDPPIARPYPIVSENIESDRATSEILKAPEPLSNVDFWGFFQYHTAYYAQHRESWRSLFQPVGDIEVKMQAAWERLRTKGKTIVAIHLRLGDYFYVCPYWIAPWQWYGEWLRGFWDTLEDPILYLASDNVEKVWKYFAPYRPIAAPQLGVELPEAKFYPDFYILSRADAVAIANSTFSFAAAMLNQQAKFFVRPHFPSQKLIPFDPWNSPPLFR